jgi:hypothetical protein
MKVTRKQLQAWSRKIIAIGYCSAHNLLYPEDSIGYNAGVYGWNYDAYYVDGIIITTGYRPIGERVNYDLLQEYETRAEKILSYDNKAPYDEKAAEVQRLLREFVSKL